MSSFSSILLVGATGTFGSLVAGELAKRRESFTRIAVYHNIARKTDELKQGRLDSFKAAGLEIVIGDGYTATEPFLGFDCVMIFSGNHGLHEQPQIIDSAINAGVRHFYPSEYGADLLVGENWSQRYYKYKVLTRDYLEKRAKEYPDLGWTYFVVGRLTEWAVTSHFGVNNREASAQIYGTPSGRQSLIGVHDAITYLVATLKDPIVPKDTDSGSLKGLRRTYRISGTSPTYKEIFDILNHITGREYEVTYLNVEDAKLE
jgi:hypothetical protein